jgi:hypothetical protein
LHLAKLQKLEIKPGSIKLQNLKLIVYFKMYTCKLENELSLNTKLERASIIHFSNIIEQQHKQPLRPKSS